MEDVSLDETVSETFSQNHSPKVSTNGTFEDSFHKRDAFQSVEAGPGLQGHSLHDHHHWDMPRFGGAKSVTSSVGVERDESVADEQTVEVGEVTEELQQVDEEEPTEIVLTQVEELELANGIDPSEFGRSIAGSVSQPPSKQGSLVMDAVESITDRITHGNVSPSQAAEAIIDLVLHPDNSDMAGSSSSGGGSRVGAPQVPPSPSKDSQEVEGPFSEEGVDGGGGGEGRGLGEGSGASGDSEMGLEEVAVSDRRPQVSEAASLSASQAPEDIDDEGEGESGGSSGIAQAHLQDSSSSENVGQEAGLCEGLQDNSGKGSPGNDPREMFPAVLLEGPVMRDELAIPVGTAAAVTALEEEQKDVWTAQQRPGRFGDEYAEGLQDVAAVGEGEAEGDQEAAEAAAVTYQSRLMQQLTASEDDDLTVYRSTDMDTGGVQPSNGALRNPGAAAVHSHTPSAPSEATAAAGVAAGRSSTTGPLESLEIDAAPEGAGASSAAAPLSAAQVAQEVQAANDAWEQTFKGLLYVDGVDALGRPVVVINADAVPPRMKSSALVYCKTHLEPVVNKGHYVLVFTARRAKLPSMWIMGAWRSLPRPYRKNVQYIVLVRPSGFLKAVLAFMRPFVSKKAGRKIKQVEGLGEISEATGGEVALQHLGTRFNVEVASQD